MEEGAEDITLLQAQLAAQTQAARTSRICAFTVV